MNHYKLINWLIFVLLSFIWGSSFILMKLSREGLSASQIASVRIFSAGFIFMLFAIFHIRKIQRSKILVVILTGICGNLLPAFLFATAISGNIDTSLAGILNSLTPLCVVVTGVLFFKSKIQPVKILGIVIAFAGLCLLTIARQDINTKNVEYASLIMIATLLYGINVNIVTHYLQGVNPLHGATVSLAFMCFPCAFILWQQGFFNLPFDKSIVFWSVIISAFLGVAGSAIATALFYILVKRAGGIFASLVTYGIPFVAIFWGIIFGEHITALQVGCLGIILCGVYLANR